MKTLECQKINELISACSAFTKVNKFAKCNLTPAEERVLLTLRSNSSKTMKEISTELNFSPAAATQFIDALIKKKLIIRKASKEDRRSFQIELAAKGKALIHSMIECESLIMADLNKGFTKNELQIIDSFIIQMTKVLKNKSIK